jgi:hypothetical protein
MMWVWYDRNDDGKYDEVLQASDAESGVATKAWKLAADGTQTPDSEAVGRLILRPDLLSSSDQARRLRRSLPSMIPGADVAVDEALGSFPAPRPQGSDRISMPQYDGFHNAVAIVNGRGFEMKLIDLDGSSVDPEAPAPVAGAHARSSAFDPEFASVRHGSFEWMYYDRDDDGKFDLIVFSGSGTPEAPSVTFEIDAGGTVRHLSSEDGGQMLRKAFAAPALNDAFTKIAPRVFPLRAIQ